MYFSGLGKFAVVEGLKRVFPGGPVVKTLCFHCRGTGSIPGQGTKIPHTVQDTHTHTHMHTNIYYIQIKKVLKT